MGKCLVFWSLMLNKFFFSTHFFIMKLVKVADLITVSSSGWVESCCKGHWHHGSLMQSCFVVKCYSSLQLCWKPQIYWSNIDDQLEQRFILSLANENSKWKRARCLKCEKMWMRFFLVLHLIGGEDGVSSLDQSQSKV